GRHTSFSRDWSSDVCSSDLMALDMEARGVRRFVYTDISRDGTLQGPNVEAYRALGEKLTKAKITASGGIGDYRDLLSIQELAPVDRKSGVEGKRGRTGGGRR